MGLLARSGQHAEALEHFRAAARLLPDRAEVCNELGDAAFRLGLPAEAEAAFGVAVRLQPASTLFRWNLQQVRAGRSP